MHRWWTCAAPDHCWVDARKRDAELDLGTRVDADPEESSGRCSTASPDIDPGARENRRVLMAARTAVGLVNYPTEWWHWSSGDRYRAVVAGAAAACYGPTSSPP